MYTVISVTPFVKNEDWVTSSGCKWDIKNRRLSNTVVQNTAQ